MAYQLVPATVIISFCNELALKALLYQTTGVDEKREHNLSAIMSRLKESDSVGIKKEVKDDLGISDSKFELLLNENSNGFVIWRYYYEGEANVSLDFLKSLFEAVKKRIKWD